MSLLEQDILIHSVRSGVLDVEPRGQGCYSGFSVSTPDHDFCVTAKAAGFDYSICGRCGTVRIAERRSQHTMEKLSREILRFLD